MNNIKEIKDNEINIPMIIPIGLPKNKENKKRKFEETNNNNKLIEKEIINNNNNYIETTENINKSFENLNIKKFKFENNLENFKKFGNPKLTNEQLNLLNKLPEKKDLSNRPGQGNKDLTYYTTEVAIQKANEVFGPDQWSSEIISISNEELTEVRSGVYDITVRAIVKVTLSNGVTKMDVGFDSKKNQKDLGKGLTNATKSAISDGVKRCLRYFGNFTGLALYNKEFLLQTKKRSFK
jgi:DNA recombination protein Rad52